MHDTNHTSALSRHITVPPICSLSCKEWLRRDHPNVFAALHLANVARERIAYGIFMVTHLPRFWRLRSIGRRLRGQWGDRVLSGPFVGMRYGGDACGSVAPPKHLGTYEGELHGVIEEIIRQAPDRIIDIGAAEGYYAVGLARALPEAQVTACDVSDKAQRLCRRLARANGVTNLTIQGGVDTQALQSLVSSPAFVLSDCEGAEIELIDPERVSGLRECQLLIELHEHLSPGVTERLQGRFGESHTARLIGVRERDGNRNLHLRFLSAPLRQLAISEFRVSGQQWLHLVPRGSACCGWMRPENFGRRRSEPAESVR